MRWPLLGLIVLTLAGAVFAVVNRTLLPLPGRAMTEAGGTMTLARPLPVGQDLVMFLSAVRNESDRPLTVHAVDLHGGGVGDVVEIVKLELGPWMGVSYVVGRTYPPSHGCVVQSLRPVRGYVVGPGEHARIAVWLRAAKPGRVNIRGHRVTYDQFGLRFHQADDVGLRLRVAPDAEPYPLGHVMDCVRDRVTVFPAGEPD